MRAFALVVHGPDHVVEMAPRAAAKLVGTVPLVWIHLDGRDAACLDWLHNGTGLPPSALSALLASETRPRSNVMGTGAIVNLRGLGSTPDDDPDSLVSIRMWADRGRVISVTFRSLADLDPVCEGVRQGRVTDPGDLIVTLAGAITTRLDPEIARLGDTIDDYEAQLESHPISHARRQIAGARSEAIDLRRFLNPQRQALEQLSQLQADWLDDADRIHLREAADRAARMAEELEAVRERSALLHEQLTDLRTEEIDRRSLTAALIALIFLPLTFITGLFGMNVPVPQWPHAFWWITGGCLAMGVGLWHLIGRQR